MGMSPAPMMPMYSMPMPVEGQPMMMQSAQPMMMPSAQPVPMMPMQPDPNDPEANAPVGYRFAGYAPVPNPGETSPGWEYKDGKWIFVGQTPAPPPMPVQMPVTEVPQPMPMFTGSAQPMMMPMQTMPMQTMPMQTMPMQSMPMQSMPMYGGYPMMMAPGGGSAAPHPGPAQL